MEKAWLVAAVLGTSILTLCARELFHGAPAAAAPAPARPKWMVEVKTPLGRTATSVEDGADFEVGRAACHVPPAKTWPGADGTWAVDLECERARFSMNCPPSRSKAVHYSQFEFDGSTVTLFCFTQ